MTTWAVREPRPPRGWVFQGLVAAVGLGQVGLVLGIEVSRLARRNADWYHLLDRCAMAASASRASRDRSRRTPSTDKIVGNRGALVPASPNTSVASAATMPGVPSGSTTTSLSTPCRRRNGKRPQPLPEQRMPLIDHRDIARQHRTKLLQSVACAVGAGRPSPSAPPLRPGPDPAHIIYLPNPTIGVRGIHHQIVAALGQPRPTTPPWSRRPPTRWPSSTPTGPHTRRWSSTRRICSTPQLESIRMLTNHEMDSLVPVRVPTGRPTHPATADDSASSPHWISASGCATRCRP